MIQFFKKQILGFLIRRWERRQMSQFRKIRDFEKLYIVDIDNTLTKSKLGKKLNHADPTPRNEMIDYIKNLIDEKHRVVFLSARDFRLFKITQNWLRTHNLAQENSLFLVSSARAKMPYLAAAIDQNVHTIYIDDLTYNHENGEIKSYHELVLDVESMSLDYRGRNFIDDFG